MVCEDIELAEEEDRVEIFATVLYQILRKEIVRRTFPEIPFAEKTVLGRGMNLLGSFTRQTRNYDHPFGSISSHVEFDIFDEIVAVGPGVTYPLLKKFFNFLLKKEALVSKGIYLKLALENRNRLDQNIFRIIHELKFILCKVLSANIHEVDSNIMKSKYMAMNVCSALLLRQKNYGDPKELSKLNKCDKQTLEKMEIDAKDELYYLARHQPNVLLPAAEEFYKLTIEILICERDALLTIKKIYLDMFTTFAENYPEKIRKIGEGTFIPSLGRKRRRTFEEQLLHGIFITLHDTKHDGRCCLLNHPLTTYRDFRLVLESGSNLERLARIIGGSKVWTSVKRYITIATRFKQWRFKCATLIMISSLGELCNIQIKESIDSIMDLLKSICSDDANIYLILTVCHTISQLCIDIGNEYLAKWQNDFFITTLLRYIQQPDVEILCERQTFDKLYALHALELCTENCLTPALKKHLPALLEAITLTLKNYSVGFYTFTFDGVRELCIKAFCTLAHTAKYYIRKKDLKLFRKQLYKCLNDYINYSLSYKEDNTHHMHYVIFNGLLKMLELDNFPMVVKNVEHYFRRLMNVNLFIQFPDAFSENFEDGQGITRTFTCPSVYILAKLSQKNLAKFQSIILPKMGNIIQLAGVEYLEIFREYTLKCFPLEDDTPFLPLTMEECLMSKSYACKALLNITKSTPNFLSDVQFEEVITVMITNVSDRMCSITQETAAETLIVVMELLKGKKNRLYWEYLEEALKCLMDAVRNQKDPMRLLLVLRQLVALCKLIGHSTTDENLKSEITEIFTSRLNYVTEFVDSRPLESVGGYIKTKSLMKAELTKVCLEIRVATLNTFLRC